jgi:hypothetical protein
MKAANRLTGINSKSIHRKCEWISLYKSKLLVILTLMLAFFNQVSAQRNLIDVPSSEIVERKKLFFQEQAVIGSKEFNTSTIFTYGLGKNFEVGLMLNQLIFKSAQGLEVNHEQPDEEPDVLINAQKGFDIKDWLQIGIGTRSGVNAAGEQSQIRFVNFDYLNSSFTFGKAEHKFVAGAYHANPAYAGEGTNWGVMAGIDAVLVKDKLHLLSDITSGTSSISVFNAGLEISLPKEWKLTLGAQFPTPGSDNDRAGIIQISKN